MLIIIIWYLKIYSKYIRFSVISTHFIFYFFQQLLFFVGRNVTDDYIQQLFNIRTFNELPERMVSYH